MRKIQPVEQLFDGPREPRVCGGRASNLPAAYFNAPTGPVALPARQNKIRCVGYSRRSKKKEGNDSIDRQHRVIDELAARITGDVVAQHYDDRKSGRTWERPEFKRLLQDAEAGEFNILIVEDIDRIARDLRIIAEAFHRFKQWGVAVYSWQKGGLIDPADVAFRGWHSAELLTMLHERAEQGRLAKVKQGFGSGLPPLGYKRDFDRPAGTWVVDEELRPAIAQAFQDRLDGLSLSSIARKLNADPRVRAAGHTSWTACRVTSLFRNSKYRGNHVYGKTRNRLDPDLGHSVIQFVPPSEWLTVDPELTQHWKIVEPEVWDAVFQTLKVPERGTKKRPATFIDRSTMTCSDCAGPIGWRVQSSNAPNNRRWFYHCINSDCRNQIGYEFSCVEDAVLKAIRIVLEGEMLQDAYAATFEAQKTAVFAELADRRAALEKRLAELEKVVNKLVDRAVLQGRLEDLLSDRNAKIAAERDAVKYELAALPDTPPTLDLARRNTLLEAFDRIVEMRREGPSYAVSLEHLYAQAYAAIRGMIQSIKIRQIKASRGFEATVVIRVDSLFQAMGAREAVGLRRTLTVAGHKDMPVFKGDSYGAEMLQVWGAGDFHATDAQFEAALPLLSPMIVDRVPRAGITPRQFVNSLFLFARTNTRTMQSRFLWDKRVKARIVARLYRICEEDGSWQRIMDMIRDRYPELFVLMAANPKSLPRPKRNRVKTP